MRILCWFGFHRWTYRAPHADELRVFPFYHQVIACVRCGVRK